MGCNTEPDYTQQVKDKQRFDTRVAETRFVVIWWGGTGFYATLGDAQAALSRDKGGVIFRRVQEGEA